MQKKKNKQLRKFSWWLHLVPADTDCSTQKHRAGSGYGISFWHLWGKNLMSKMENVHPAPKEPINSQQWSRWFCTCHFLMLVTNEIKVSAFFGCHWTCSLQGSWWAVGGPLCGWPGLWVARSVGQLSTLIRKYISWHSRTNTTEWLVCVAMLCFCWFFLHINLFFQVLFVSVFCFYLNRCSWWWATVVCAQSSLSPFSITTTQRHPCKS